jgi:RHS repeat-associated protein
MKANAYFHLAPSAGVERGITCSVSTSSTSVERYQYDPYGSRTVLTPSFVELNESTINQEFGYTGRRHDAEDTGLMYFRARYYSGELGRFVSRDPLGYGFGC